MGRKRTLPLELGVFESELCSGQFLGDIQLRRDLATIQLGIKGTMQPRPTLFEDVDNPSMVMIDHPYAVRGQKYAFPNIRDLYNPGIFLGILSAA